VSCTRCSGIGWVCEEHPDKPIEHRIASDIFCSYAGAPCPDCNPAEPPRLPEGWQSIAKVAPFPLPANCPLCGARVAPAGITAGLTYKFTCSRHGLLILTPDGLIRRHPS
jgi:hypothetical protein